MSHKLLSIASFHEALFVLDVDLAHSCRQSGCWHCGGRLHVSDYERKPRGVPEAFRSYYAHRLLASLQSFRNVAQHPIGSLGKPQDGTTLMSINAGHRIGQCSGPGLVPKTRRPGHGATPHHPPSWLPTHR